MASKISFQYLSRCGVPFSVTPELTNEINELIANASAEIEKQVSVGKFIAYLSIPISSRGGGDFRTNAEMSKHITQNVRATFGEKLWILNPALYSLPEGATGGDYMAAWADVLSGENGLGDHLDMVYFVGPNDVWSFFGVKEGNRLGRIDEWLTERAAKDPHYKKIAEDDKLRKAFIRFYGLRGSVVYSKGCHDEWNIITAINTKRPVGNDIVVYFDGVPIEPGDYRDSIAPGYEARME